MSCDVEQQVTNGIWSVLIGLMLGAGGYLLLSEGFKTKKHEAKVEAKKEPRKLSSGLGALGGE